MSNTENAWRDGRVLREKQGISGDVIALKVDHLPPGPGCARSRLRITKRSVGLEVVLTSEEMYTTAQFDAQGNIELLFDVVLADFENEFKNQVALMDAADAVDAVDRVLSDSVNPPGINSA